MTGQLITLPARLWARGARRLLHTAEDVTGMALMGTLRVAAAVGNLRSDTTDSPATTSAPARPATATQPRPARTNGVGTTTRTRPERVRPRAPEDDNGAVSPLASERLEEEGRTVSVDLDSPPPAAPDHVSEEPVVVREEAEPGAEEGAGAAVSVDAPWEGYGRMAARDIVARLPASSTAELAAVQLYESSHRKRQTVLKAVERELVKPGR